MAAAIPAAAGTTKGVELLSSRPWGKGLGLILSAFVMLGMGVLVQWRKMRETGGQLASGDAPAPGSWDEPDAGDQPTPPESP